MIFIMNIIIDLCLIFAIWKLSRRNCCYDSALIQNKIFWRQIRRLEGLIKSRVRNGMKVVTENNRGAVMKAKLAEKLADRAFNMASAANLGVVALQKSLAVRSRYVSKEQSLKNEVAKKEVDNLFSNSNGFDWLRPILSDEELDVLDKAEDHARKFQNEEVAQK